MRLTQEAKAWRRDTRAMPVLEPLEFLQAHGRDFPAWDLAESLRYTRSLTRAHYENFSVASRLVPKRLRQDYCNVYAYCRWADDLGDETGDPQLSLDLLQWWRAQLDAMERGEAHHPVFVGLKETAERHDLPRQDFEDLLRAFEQDQNKLRYASYDELLEYCRYSANPVGRLVLRLNGYRDPELFGLSDSICTALQLANHWQDVARDWDIGRVYMPEDVMAAHGTGREGLAEDMARGHASPQYRETVRDLTDRADRLFTAGLPLADRLSGRLGVEIELFAKAGMAVLDKIRSLGFDTISQRPTMTGRDHAALLAQVLVRRLLRTPLPISEAHNVHG